MCYYDVAFANHGHDSSRTHVVPCFRALQLGVGAQEGRTQRLCYVVMVVGRVVVFPVPCCCGPLQAELVGKVPVQRLPTVLCHLIPAMPIKH